MERWGQNETSCTALTQIRCHILLTQQDVSEYKKHSEQAEHLKIFSQATVFAPV